MSPVNNSACQVCENSTGNKIHVAREMMLGLGGEFPYLECGNCGCLQLIKIPPDMPRYYPANYYSFGQHGKFTTFLRRARVRHALGRFDPLGGGLAALMGANDAVLAIRRADVSKSASIVDIGCGSGRLLLDLAHLGYSDLSGADPYLDRDYSYPNGPRLFKRRIQDLEGRYDLIMMHHSFEHLENPLEVMKATSRLLQPNGRVIIRIPVAASFAWREYGINWVNLDAPRHFFLHTTASIKLLADQSGLRLREIRHEGGSEVFWASEQYREGVCMVKYRSEPGRKLRGILRSWADRPRARRLNETKQADIVCFQLGN